VIPATNLGRERKEIQDEEPTAKKWEGEVWLDRTDLVIDALTSLEASLKLRVCL